jgi:hypothetical protein
MLPFEKIAMLAGHFGAEDFPALIWLRNQKSNMILCWLLAPADKIELLGRAL